MSSPDRLVPSTRAAATRLLCLGLLGLAATAARAGDRIVAVGDLHGNLDALVSILAETALIDGEHHWTGGDATLVQTGDVVDRAPRLRDVFSLLMRLQVEARDAGGRVEVLLGNHEIMNLEGVLREVDPTSFAAFRDERSSERRAAALTEFERFQKRQARYLGLRPPTDEGETRRQWLDAHPLGKVEYLAAFLPDGDIGRWLRARPAVVVLGDTLFVHGGLGPAAKGLDAAAINRRVEEELETFDRTRAVMADLGLVQPTSSIHLMSQIVEHEIGLADRLVRSSSGRDRRRAQQADRLRSLIGWERWLVNDETGPLWTSGPTVWDEEDDRSEVLELLASWNVERMVVAHIPRFDGRIRARFEGRLLLIDTWMEHWPEKGAPAALEIENGRLTAVYPGERELLATAAPDAEGDRAGASLRPMATEM